MADDWVTANPVNAAPLNIADHVDGPPGPNVYRRALEEIVKDIHRTQDRGLVRPSALLDRIAQRAQAALWTGGDC